MGLFKKNKESAQLVQPMAPKPIQQIDEVDETQTEERQIRTPKVNMPQQVNEPSEELDEEMLKQTLGNILERLNRIEYHLRLDY